ncbi:MAG: ATP-binding protein [Desulfatibacillaceae bacterium]
MPLDGLAEGIYKPRILVVDDEQRIRDACQLVLEEQGFDVELAADGETGLELIGERHFDIVLVDLMLPALSGLDVLARIRSRHPDSIVIVITGYATVEHSIKAMKNGAFDFIPKPFTPEQLRVVVDKAFEHYRALQDISETRSRLRVMVNRLMDGVMTTDSEKNIVLANPAFLHMIEYHGGNIVGKNVDEVIENETLRQLVDQAVALPPDASKEIYGEVATGSGDEEKIYSVCCAPFRARTGFTLGTLTVLHDITTLKRVDRMKSEFVSMVSHEIRSPMNSIMAQLKVVLDGLAGDVTDKQREILEKACARIMSLTSLVSEILDLARIESGLIGQEKQAVDVCGILREQVELHAALARDKDIALSLAPCDGLPLIVANRQGVEEIVSNLVTNAIKYTPDGGRVDVKAVVENEYVRIDVADTGFGIPHEDMDNVFSRFYRVKNEQTRHIQGTGLGLAIVKSIVQAHHGSIRVESHPGSGSTFTVHLPLPTD